MLAINDLLILNNFTSLGAYEKTWRDPDIIITTIANKYAILPFDQNPLVRTLLLLFFLQSPIGNDSDIGLIIAAT
jgi:hypothetical protein